MMIGIRGISLAGALLTLVNCGQDHQRRQESDAHLSRVTHSAPTLDELKNATYRGIEGLPDAVTLTKGRWEGEPFVAGGAARPSLYYARDFFLAGDVDGDGNAEAVALLGENSGGSGERVYLAVVRRDGIGVACVAVALLGDRVKVRDARIESGQIEMDVLQAGPGDPMCCPGDLVTRAWRLQDGRLVEQPPTSARRLTPAVLDGVEWVLSAWSWDEPAPDEPGLTAVFADGRVTGNAGCNRYFASVGGDSVPGGIALTGFGDTLAACPDPIDLIEARFLAQMKTVTRFSFVAGMLSLEYDSGGGPAAMLFARRPPAE
ncbi:MAG TPA: META domain-containing protein [Candidatus Krumholzibacteria bacterium]|nr:META domain-containing protein [Candidatus Krumholzibacteria bacterium]